MRAPGGYATISDPERGLIEYDTVTCAHCQRVVFVKPGTGATVYLDLETGTEDSGAFCVKCMRAICLPCCAGGRCRPWERQIEQSEARDRLRRQALGQYR